MHFEQSHDTCVQICPSASMGDSSGEEYYSAPESDKEELGTNDSGTEPEVKSLETLSVGEDPSPQQHPDQRDTSNPTCVEPDIRDNDSKASGTLESDTSRGTTTDSHSQEFVSGLDNRLVSDDQEVVEGDRVELSEEQIKELKEQASKLKADGNTSFKAGEYIEATDCYSKAIELYPPSECAHEIAVCYANRAACHMKLEKHQAVIDDCTQTLELEPTYLKAILRRAQACEALEKYEDALADYKSALEIDPTQAAARQAVVYLPDKIKEQNEKLKAEMLGKLKELGNALLSPFGLSTNNFQLQQDPNTGSYSVNFKR